MPIVFAAEYDEAANASIIQIDASLSAKTFLTNEDYEKIDERLDELEENGGGSGEAGNDGFSPIAKVEQTDAGAVITITDKDGATTATVYNGEDGVDGSDGYTPKKGVDYFDGKDGADGYTPVKGVDYFDGSPGKNGEDGKTAYEYAKEGGFTGTEAEFAQKLARELPTKLSELENDKGYLTSYTETDPTVPSWAKATSKPSYSKSEVGLGNVDNVKQYSASNPPPYPVSSVNGKTGAVSLKAADVGADASGTAATAVSNHNVSDDAHNDIRLLISGLTARLDALANSDDTTLDQMAEVVEYIKDNRDLIEQVTTGKVNVSDIVNNLTTNASNKPLSAAQGVALKSLIDGLDTALGGKLATSELTNAINTALAQAKASGEFDGADGADGAAGKDGTSVTVKSVSESSADGGSNVVTFSDGKTLTVKNGSKGSTGDTGPAGERGETGETGATGERGTGILKVTTALTAASGTGTTGAAIAYKTALSTVKSEAGVDKVLVGDIVSRSYYLYPVVMVDDSYVYLGAYTSIRGATGAAGATPVKGEDYFTATDKAEMIAQMQAALPKLTVTGTDADGVSHTWIMYGTESVNEPE